MNISKALLCLSLLAMCATTSDSLRLWRKLKNHWRKVNLNPITATAAAATTSTVAPPTTTTSPPLPTTPPPTSSPPSERSVAPPDGSCHELGEIYPNGHKWGEGYDEETNWCYGYFCYDGQVMAWDNFYCRTTVPPPTTTLPPPTPTPGRRSLALKLIYRMIQQMVSGRSQPAKQRMLTVMPTTGNRHRHRRPTDMPQSAKPRMLTVMPTTGSRNRHRRPTYMPQSAKPRMLTADYRQQKSSS